MTFEPAVRESAICWELRAAWARLREVALSLVDGGRVCCYVEHVAPSGAFCLVWDGGDELHVPVAMIAAVRQLSYEEGDFVFPLAPPRLRSRAPVQIFGQMELPGCVSERTAA